MFFDSHFSLFQSAVRKAVAQNTTFASVHFFIDAREETSVCWIPWKSKIAICLACVATVGVKHPHGAGCSDAKSVRPVPNNGSIALMQLVEILCFILDKDVDCVVKVTDACKKRAWVRLQRVEVQAMYGQGNVPDLDQCQYNSLKKPIRTILPQIPLSLRII
jgi:hypothetical protein